MLVQRQAVAQAQEAQKAIDFANIGCEIDVVCVEDVGEKGVLEPQASYQLSQIEVKVADVSHEIGWRHPFNSPRLLIYSLVMEDLCEAVLGVLHHRLPRNVQHELGDAATQISPIQLPKVGVRDLVRLTKVL